MPKQSFPGGSRSRVNRAGNNVRSGLATPEDMQVIDEWRAAHRNVLNTFQAILRTKLRFSETVVAQRHKRRSTIFYKLQRLPNMQLARMDDVAGCRAIFKNAEELREFRSEMHEARFRHQRKNDVDKYDYIAHPKRTGYRGIHDVYAYDVRSQVGEHLKGLLVEIQYRTEIQHAWATAVEVIGLITESQPKFEKGDERFQDAMALASEILARGHEKTIGPLPEMSDSEVVKRFLSLDRELHLMDTLRALNQTDLDASRNKNAILIFDENGELEIRSFRHATDALDALFKLEKDKTNRDIVLVRADSSDEVRFAYRNYFSDARDFIGLVETGCRKLTKIAKREKSQKKSNRVAGGL